MLYLEQTAPRRRYVAADGGTNSGTFCGLLSLSLEPGDYQVMVDEYGRDAAIATYPISFSWTADP